MLSRVVASTALLRTVVDESRAENVTLLAGSLAYLSFVSLVPSLALLFLAVTVVVDETLAATVLSFTKSFLPPRAQELLQGYVVGDAAPGTASASLVGVAMLLWGSLKAFRGLDAAFSRIYCTTGENSLSNQVSDALVVLVGLGVALVSVVAVTTVLATASALTVRLLGPVVLVAGLSLAFLPMYYRFPDVDLTVREVLPGVAAAAVGWVVLQQTFQIYLAVTGRASAADVVGAVLVLLTWLYFGSLVVLVGAVFNAVLSGHRARATTDVESGATPAGRLSGEHVLFERYRLQRRRNREVTGGGSDATSSRAPGPLTSDAEARRRRFRRLERQARWSRRAATRVSSRPVRLLTPS
jgi:membrane protein